MDRKRIPVGYEDIKRVIDEGLYFVDKSLMIKELLDGAAMVLLLTRPRRFGKTLNLSMLRRFFEDERTEKGEKIDNGYIFEGLAISECGERYLAHQQQYPVINLSLKSAKQPTYEMAHASLVDEIIKECQRHAYVLEGDMPERERERLERILLGKAEAIEYAKAIQFLSECLKNYHGKEVVILIDEYDVPLENAYFAGFYEKMIGFIRSLFESALKTNAALAFGVITGCLRISRESIFTGLNNLEIHSVLSYGYSDCFGFTEMEVKDLLEYYGLSEKYAELKRWYDGYRFGGQEIYNPWSIINYVKTAGYEYDAFPRPYWSNTSSNSIVRELIEGADDEVRREIEQLMEGETIEKPVHDAESNLVNSSGAQNELSARRFFEINETKPQAQVEFSEKNILNYAGMDAWNFLYFTGYLRECGRRMEQETFYVRLSIPNTEIRLLYRQTILSWFDKKVKEIDKRPFIRALEEGDCQAAERFVSRQLMDTISYFDYKESYYHGFMTGLCSGIEGYQIQSNRESGTGRPDLIFREKEFGGRAMILELKVAERLEDMEKCCFEALRQIEEQNYEAELILDGYENIAKYGVCFYKKRCKFQKGQ